MKFIENSLDKSAIALSGLCLAHCLLLPIITVLLPTIIATTLNQELFHIAMVICVLPISIYALTLGCKKHKNMHVVVYGGLGLTTLVLAIIFGESHLEEVGEKVLTSIGAIVIAFAHIQNYKLCIKSEECSC